MIRRRAFTLIELMIVVAIIGIMAVLAVTMMNRAAPRARLLAADAEVQQYLLKARTRAAQTRVSQKICLFSDADASDAVSGGRLIWMEWDDLDATNTPTTPPGSAACNDEYAYTTATGYITAAVAAPPMCDSHDGRWCVREEIDWSPATHPTATLAHPLDGVSIFRFKTGGAWQPALKSLELTYGPLGSIVGYSSLTQGTIQLSNQQECLTPSRCTASDGGGFADVFDVDFVLGGAVRATEGL